MNIRAMVDGKGVDIFVLSFLLTWSVSIICNEYIQGAFTPNLPLVPLLGLLFGPFASLGSVLGIVALIFFQGAPAWEILAAIPTMFIVSYLPYRLWYSTFLKGDGERAPNLDSVQSVTKFIVISAIASFVYTLLHCLVGCVEAGTSIASYYDAAILLNMVSFLTLIGMGMMIVMKVLGIQPYTPRRPILHIRRDRLTLWSFNSLLLSCSVFCAFILIVYTKDMPMGAITIVTYIMITLFLLKPMSVSDPDKENARVSHNKATGVEYGLMYRMIVIFIFYGMMICCAFAVAADAGIVDSLPGWSTDQSTLFYMGASLMIFFSSAMIFLWYVEKNVTVPLGRMSDAAWSYRDIVSKTGEAVSAVYGEYTDRKTEIGGMARSLTKMSNDIDDYINDIKALNDRHERYVSELSVARSIQESFVPKDFASVRQRGVDIYGSMVAAEFVGGDIYDFFMVDDDHLAFAIGDVSGKGVPASLYMVLTKMVIEGHSSPGISAGDILTSANKILANNEQAMFVSVWLGILEISTGVLSFSNAGHNPPVIARAGRGSELLNARCNLVLGGVESTVYSNEEMVLSKGDRIILYTDGVTEANNDDYDAFYGTERLLHMADGCLDLTVGETVSTIRHDVTEFMGEADQFDDFTLLVVEYRGTDGH